MAGEGNNKGWISIYRNLQDHWLWQEKPFSKGQAWIDLLLSANHQDKKIMLDSNLYEVKRGSFITSIRKLCERWGWSNSKVKKFLDTLQSDEMIAYKSDTRKTTINIVSYEVYQTLSDTKNDTETSHINHTSITEALQKHTNNNDNNVNNDNNDNKYMHNDLDNKAINLCKYYLKLKPNESITQHLAQLKIWISRYGYDWTKEAIEKTVANKNRFIQPYIEKILMDWTANGKEDVKVGSTKRRIESADREGIGLEF